MNHQRPTRDRERGSVLVTILFVAFIASGVLSTLMGRSLVEQNRADVLVAQERAAWRSRGEVELAVRRVADATYTLGDNDVLVQALASVPPVVAGTSVVVEQIPGTRWHRLTALGEFDGEETALQALLRDGTSYVAYNYYVEGAGLGVSGTPSGKIHANGPVDFYFAGGRYDDFVSSSTGFDYKNGATPENTTMLAGGDPAAEPKDLLQKVDFPSMESQAVFVAPPGLEAEVRLMGDQLRVRLYSKPYTTTVEETRNNWVYIGDAWEEVTRSVYIGDALVDVQQAVYRTEQQMVSVRKSRLVWVEFDASSGTGTDVAGGTAATGYWDTEYYYEDELRDVQVFDHNETVQELQPQYENQTQFEWVPQYENQPYTVTETITVYNELVSEDYYPSYGVFYFPDIIRDVEGDLNGHVTLVTEMTAEIDGSIRYVDDMGETAYLNGTDPSQPYLPNPDFERNHSFAIIAQGDVRYDRYAPSSMEINGSLISTTGMVGYEGIAFDGNGDPYRTQSARILTSLRRLGGVLCFLQPVATLLSDDGQVEHGFRTGNSVYDHNLLTSPPPGSPTENVPTLSTISRVSAQTIASNELTAMPDNVAPIDGLLAVPAAKNLARTFQRDWGHARDASY